jgi:hypothetical protein
MFTPLIKGQRQERAEEYIKHLERRLTELSAQVDANSRDALELIEQGLLEAVERARRNRVRQIAASVAHGIRTDPADQVNRELISIVAQLEPDDLIMLHEVAVACGLHPGFRFRKNDIARMASWARLQRFSLIEFTPVTRELPSAGRIGYRNERITVPVYDGFGAQEGHYAVTPFGRAILDSVDLKEVPSTSIVDEADPSTDERPAAERNG